MKYFLKISALAWTLVLLASQVSAENNYSGPDDMRAVEEAEKASGLLGPDRGAISFSGRSVDIIGLEAVSFSGVSARLTGKLRTLGAKQVGTEIRISLSGDVLFVFDKWNIKKDAEKRLLQMSDAIKELNPEKVIIEGHTDSKGAEDYNLKLSQKRAEAVREWFISKGGLKNITFRTKGYGEARPVASNTNPDGSDNPEARAKNRRVEIRIKD